MKGKSSNSWVTQILMLEEDSRLRDIPRAIDTWLWGEKQVQPQQPSCQYHHLLFFSEIQTNASASHSCLLTTPGWPWLNPASRTEGQRW